MPICRARVPRDNGLRSHVEAAGDRLGDCSAKAAFLMFIIIVDAAAITALTCCQYLIRSMQSELCKLLADVMMLN